MAPLPPNNTARYKVHYTIGATEHTTEDRALWSPSAEGTFIVALFSVLSPGLSAGVIGTVEFAAAGSDIFNPVVTGAEGTTFGAGVTPDEDIPRFVSFAGRSAGGKRIRKTIYGISQIGLNYRFSPGEWDVVDDAIAVLAAAEPDLLAIDGLPPVWKTYANAGFNSHWQRALR